MSTDPDARPSRRRVLRWAVGGAAGVAAVAAGGGAALTALDPTAWRRARAAVGWPVPGPDTTPSTPAGGAGVRLAGTFASRACQRDVGWQVALPPGAAEGDRLPVALVLHGRGGDARAAFDGLALDRFLADAVTGGAAPFALASVDGGDHSYWHRRTSGEDPQAMLLEEYLPLLADRGLSTDRFGLFGWSMGGYGALLLATAAGPGRAAGVAADSPALWQRFDDSAPGAFDDAADFAAHDVFAAAPALQGVPVRLACGDLDPFIGATRAFADGVPDLAGTDFGPGGHDQGCWRSSAPAQLRFLAGVLSPPAGPSS